MTKSKNQEDKFILVTRPKEDAAGLLEILEQRKLNALSSPLLTISFNEPEEDFTNWLGESQALVMTSANGVRALLHQEKHRHSFLRLPVYAVGDSTAREAEQAGFAKVFTAAGDVDKLGDLIKEKLNPENGPLLHIASNKLAGDLAGDLSQAGFILHRANLYKSTKASELSIDVIEAFAHERVRAVLFYSPRTSESFTALVEKAKLGETLKQCSAICLSPNVAKNLNQADWNQILIAKNPTQNDLLSQLDILMSDTENQQANDLLSQHTAEDIIEAFGGIRPMANKIGVAVSTVQGWKNRNSIPESHREQIIEAAQKENLSFPEKKDAKKEEPIIIEGSAEEVKPASTSTSDQDNKEAPASNDKTSDETEPKVVKKRVSTFSIVGIPLLGLGLILQPYWGPAVGNAIEPIVSKFAPNLAAIREERRGASSDMIADQIAKATADLRAEVSSLKTQLANATQTPTNTIDPAEITALIEENSKPLADAISQLEEKLASQALITNTADGSTIDLGPLHEELAALKEAQSASGETLTKLQTELAEKLELTEQKLAAQEAAYTALSQQAAPATKNNLGVATLVQVMETSNALNKGQDIKPYLAQLKALAKDEKEILDIVETLSLISEEGIPNLYQLQKRFVIVAANPEALKTDAPQEEWVEATLNNLQNLISIRRVGEDENAPPISRAEAALNRGDLSEAIRILTPLKTEREDVQDWLYYASKLDRAETKLTELRQIASGFVLGNLAGDAQ